MIRARITSIALVAVASIGCTPTRGSGAESDVGTPEISEVAASERAVPMIVDYSPTLSDVPALLFLTTRPDVDLRAVTLPGTGESDCEPGVRHTRSLLVIAGRPDVPVACGRDGPMAGDRDWPLSFREASRSFPGVVLPRVTPIDQGDAVELLSDTLAAAEHPVSIVALGPLTNLGRAFEARPELADRVASIITMGGAFDVAGNVFPDGEIAPPSADAEWNYYIDPESVRMVLASSAPITIVPLDATNDVPGNRGMLSRLSATTATDAGEAVRQLWSASLDTEQSIAAEWWYFWDELAAVIAVEPSVATITERAVAIDDSGATVEHEDGATVMVATAADLHRFEQTFLDTFAAGNLPDIELSDDLQRYLETVRSGTASFATTVDDSLSRLAARADDMPADQLVGEMLDDVFDAAADLETLLTDTAVPEQLRPDHDALLGAVTLFLDAELSTTEALTDGIPTAPIGSDALFGALTQATEAAGLDREFTSTEAACRDLASTAFRLGAVEDTCLLP